MKQYYGIIAAVEPGGLADEIGLTVGDKIVSVNGKSLTDIIDLSFSLADEEIELLVEHDDGQREMIAFDKDYDEELGVEFVSAVFDGIKRCHNKCYFCFVDQMRDGLRPSLYVKDDDYRMSFLYGNFVTLTNITEEDLTRIERLHLSPLYISVHVTDGERRGELLHNKKASAIVEQLKRLAAAGIELHTQIVLCPGVNDGALLERTVTDLAALRPHILSVAIVPVGLTRYRERCYPLTRFTAAAAADLIAVVTQWQEGYRRESGSSFVYLGDEFYCLAGRQVPAGELYDGFPQLENGIGLTRDFIDQWEECSTGAKAGYVKPLRLAVTCGVAAEPLLARLCASVAGDCLAIDVIPVVNEFFGLDITVSGLLAGQDIVAAVKRREAAYDGLIIPAASLRRGGNKFLDDYTVNDVEAALGLAVQCADGAGRLLSLLTDWHNAGETGRTASYTWQSNGAYTKK